MRLVMQETIATLPYKPANVTTPTMASHEGTTIDGEVSTVSILRSGLNTLHCHGTKLSFLFDSRRGDGTLGPGTSTQCEPWQGKCDSESYSTSHSLPVAHEVLVQRDEETFEPKAATPASECRRSTYIILSPSRFTLGAGLCAL